MAKSSRGGQRGNSGISASSNKVLGKKGAPKTIEEALQNVNKTNYDKARNEWRDKYDKLHEQYQNGEISKSEFASKYEQLNGGYDINCQRCVWAYELQRRGYDVEALPNLEGDNPNSLSRGGNWMKLDKNSKGSQRLAEYNYYKQESNKDASNNALKMMSEWGDGSRGIIRLARKSGSGHVFNVEYSKGKIIAVDAQTGEKYTSLWKALTQNKAVPYTVQLVRTDNAVIDMTQVNKYVKKRGA